MIKVDYISTKDITKVAKIHSSKKYINWIMKFIENEYRFYPPLVIENQGDFDDFDDFDDTEFEDDTEWDDGEDLEEMSDDEFTNAKEAMNKASGNHQEFLKDGDYYYDLLPEEESACKLIRYDGIDWDVVVPDTVAGLKAKVLDCTFSNNAMVETVELPESVEIIDNMCFWMCSGLTKIVIPEGVTTLGRCAFGGCGVLENPVFPESLETVGEMVFIACNSFTEITFGKNLKSIGSNAFTGCEKLEKVTVPRGTEIAEDAFEQCPMMKEVVYYDP